MRFIGVNFHYVRPEFNLPFPGLHGLTTEQFEARLRALGTMGTFVSMADVTRSLNGQGELPDKSILVTFDDGLREQYDHAWPVLKKLGVPATFFVNTRPIADAKVLTVHKIHLLRSHVEPDEFFERVQLAASARGIDLDNATDEDQAHAQYVYDSPRVAVLSHLLNFRLSADERAQIADHVFDACFPGREPLISSELYLSPGQIAELASAGSIGTHSHDHYPLGLLQPVHAHEQIARSLDHLAEWTGRQTNALSYPYGLADSSSLGVQKLAEDLGLDLGFTMERAVNVDFRLPFAMGRFDANDVPGGKSCRLPVDEFFDRAPTVRWFRE
ncbi:MAG: polysaccharide deacetylase family protein [Deltaproteobacteria bacterium]|nr:polysaccharide deacetylase family protein [Deltaproteobacteria bacterium]